MVAHGKLGLLWWSLRLCRPYHSVANWQTRVASEEFKTSAAGNGPDLPLSEVLGGILGSGSREPATLEGQINYVKGGIFCVCSSRMAIWPVGGQFRGPTQQAVSQPLK
ncbi:MAG: hypothetical protein ACI87E_003826 [Mariniblastus sp.]|jgi:hypothetical protein